MLEKYFSAPKTLRRLRGGISGPHIDGFADRPRTQGICPGQRRSIHSSGRSSRLLRSAERRRSGGHRSQHLDSFSQHLRRCRCPHFKRGKIGYHSHFGVKLFHRHLVGCGICAPEPVQDAAAIQFL